MSETKVKIPFYAKELNGKPLEVTEKEFQKILEKFKACGRDFAEACVEGASSVERASGEHLCGL